MRKTNKTELHKVPFRDFAGVLTAFCVVASFIAIGFVSMLSMIFLGTEVEVPGDWMAAMLSLASASLGYLIGKQHHAPKENEIGTMFKTTRT